MESRRPGLTDRIELNCQLPRLLFNLVIENRPALDLDVGLLELWQYLRTICASIEHLVKTIDDFGWWTAPALASHPSANMRPCSHRHARLNELRRDADTGKLGFGDRRGTARPGA